MKVLIISSWKTRFLPERTEWCGVEFTRDLSCRDYDWAVVYDELPHEANHIDLACSLDRTILVTQEPQIIKVQSPVYTRQFNYVLTTCDPQVLRHRHYRRGCGCLVQMTGHTMEELAVLPEFEKTELVSNVCSRKLMRHTNHYKRHQLLEYLYANLPGFVWKGQGICEIDRKCEALDSFRYHVAIENTVQPYHWTEKVADPIYCLSLPFYAGDPKLEQVLPPQSFIRIPVDNPPEALRIIKEAIAKDEYSKRLPALREARRLLVERYNLYSQVLEVIREHEERAEPERPAGRIYNRHYLRRNPLYALEEVWNSLRACRYLRRLPSPVQSEKAAGSPSFLEKISPEAWKGIDGVVVINMESRTDRYTAFMENVGKFVPPERLVRINAVVGKELPGYGKRPWFTERTGERAGMWAGAAGCALSHRHAIELARDRGWKNVLILEDDARAGGISGAETVLQRALGTLQGRYLLYLGFHRPEPYGKRILREGAISLWKVDGALAAHAYILSSPAYNAVLDAMPEADNIWAWMARYRAIDTFYRNFVVSRCGVSVYVLYPTLFFQEQDVSDIGGKLTDFTKCRCRRAPYNRKSLRGVLHALAYPFLHAGHVLMSTLKARRSACQGLPGKRHRREHNSQDAS